MHRNASLSLIAALLLGACVGGPNTPAASRSPGAGTGSLSSSPMAKPSPSANASTVPGNGGGLVATPAITAIAGTVTAPSQLVAGGGVALIGADGASMVAAGAGNLVAAGGGNMVAAGAGNIVAAGAGNYALSQAAGAFLPVARARVYLTSGDEVLPIAPVETDAQGNYRFPKVPSGFTYQVVVSIITPGGKTGRLASLVKPGATGAVADVSPVTTMVCAATVGTAKAIGDVDPARFQAATAALGKLLANQSGGGVDLADPKALPKLVATLVEKAPEAMAALKEVSEAVAKDARGAQDVAAAVTQLGVATCLAPEVAIAPTPGTAGDFPAAPSAIAVAGKTIYLGDRERRRVAVVEDGKLVRAIDGLEPLALAVAGGALFIGDATDGKVLRIAADGTRTEIAADQAYEPTAIAVAADGTVYFADATRHAIFRVDAAGGVPTLLVGGKPGYADGAGAAARLYRPSGLALVGDVLYVADAGNRRVRKVTLAGTAQIGAFAGSGAAGNADGQGTAARFGYPAAIAADGEGTLWVADAASRTIRRVTAGGQVDTTLQGGCVLDAEGLSFAGGLTFADAALWLLDGDRVVRRPVGPQPSPSPSAAASPSASPDAAASPAGSPSPSPSASPSTAP